MIEKSSVPGHIFLVFIDAKFSRNSHVLKVESVKTIEGKEVFVVPQEYTNCCIAATELEGISTIKEHFNSIIISVKAGLIAEKTMLIDELYECSGTDPFSIARRKKLNTKIGALTKQEVELILMSGCVYRVETYSARYSSGHSIRDIEL